MVSLLYDGKYEKYGSSKLGYRHSDEVAYTLNRPSGDPVYGGRFLMD
jgi:hypothetical protein